MGDPVGLIDPLGLRDVIVAIWLDRPLLGEVGHVFVGEMNGNVLLSQFPLPHATTGENMTYNWSATLNAEGRRPDAVFKVNIPNDKAFNGAVTNMRDRSTWNWLPSNRSQTQCAYAADTAIRSGGGPGVLTGAILPRDIYNAYKWNDARSDAITALPGVPW